MNRPRRSSLAAGALVLAGAIVILATIVWKWGHLSYGLGAVAVAIGVVWLVVLFVRGTIWKVALSAAAVVVLAAVAVVAVSGFPQQIPQWTASDGADGPDDWSARTGELIIIGGTARDVETGAVAWAFEGKDAKPLLVDESVVVIGTKDGSIGVDPSTGREIWRSEVTGRGIAHDGEILVVARTTSDTATEAVALDLATGKVVWEHDGRPIMECDLGPADRFSPAREQAHVLLIKDEEHDGSAELLSLADGHTTIADVDCSLTARVVGDVLIEADGKSLTGRLAADGQRLWSTRVEQPYRVEGGGSTVFTPTSRAGTTPVDVTAIDVMTGKTTIVQPPAGTRAVQMDSAAQRAPEVWTLLELDAGPALWNPGTGAVVEVPGVFRIGIDSIDTDSGWVALSGTTRDLTGAESNQCWALSQDGQLSGPFPGRTCSLAEGLLETEHGVYPIP